MAAGFFTAATPLFHEGFKSLAPIDTRPSSALAPTPTPTSPPTPRPSRHGRWPITAVPARFLPIHHSTVFRLSHEPVHEPKCAVVSGKTRSTAAIANISAPALWQWQITAVPARFADTTAHFGSCTGS